jgi:hypothetical protein
MKISINDHRKINAIQAEFSEMFPFLKIEFFAKPHQSTGMASDKLIKYGSKTIGECRTIHNMGILTISSEMSSTDLENNFRDIFGLNIKLFRKSGNEWLPVTLTEGWSLNEQNSQGKELAR